MILARSLLKKEQTTEIENTYLIFEDLPLKSFLSKLYPISLVDQQLAHGGIRVVKLVKRQLLFFAYHMKVLGITKFHSNRLVRLFFGTSNHKVLTNIFQTIIVPIASRTDREWKGTDLQEIPDELVDQILEDLPVQHGAFSNAADRLEYTLSGIINTMLGKTIFFRQLIQGLRFLNVFEHPNLIEDFSPLGIFTIDDIEIQTFRSLKDCQQIRLQRKHLNPIIRAYILGIRFRKSATLAQTKQGTDMLILFDLSKVSFDQLKKEFGSISDFEPILSFLKKEKEPKRVIQMEMKTAEGFPRNILKTLYDLKSTMAFDHGCDLIDALSFDLKGILDQWNTLLARDELDVNHPEKYFDLKAIQKFSRELGTFLRLPKIEQVRFLKKEVLSKQFRFHTKFISEHILPYLETLKYLEDVAAIDEWFRSGSVIRLNLTGILKTSQPNYLETDIIHIDACTQTGRRGWIKLERNQPPLRIQGNELVFGPEMIDDQGYKIVDNPFMISGDELREAINQAVEEIKKALPKLGRENPGISIITPKTIKEIERFIEITHFNGSLTLEEIPPAIKNVLTHYLKDRLYRNPKFGITGGRQQSGFVHIKAVKGYGNRHFTRIIKFLSENRFFSSDCYDEFVLTLVESPRIKPKQNIPIGTEEVFTFTELLQPKFKATLEMDGWTFNTRDKPCKRIQILQPAQLNNLVHQPNQLHLVANINPQYGALYFRKPVGLKKVYFSTKKVKLNGKLITFTGSLLDLTRFNVLPTDTTLADITNQWNNHSLTGTNAKDSFVKALKETLQCPQNHDIAMELIYFGDTKTAIGAFIAPLFDLLDKESQEKVTTVAKKRVSTIAPQLKNGSITRSIKRAEVVIQSTQFKSFKKFSINRNNAMLWFLDAVMDDNRHNIQLKIKKKEYSDILAALTFNPTKTNVFRITEIVIVKKFKQSPTYAQKLLQLQEGIIKYNIMLTYKARKITKKNIDQIRDAFTKLRNSKNKPYSFNQKTLNVVPKYLAPSNIVKAPSGQIISFTKKFTPYYFAFDVNFKARKGKLPQVKEIVNNLFMTKEEIQKHLNMPINDFLRKLNRMNDQKEIQSHFELSTKKKHK